MWKNTNTFPCVASITAIFASICIAIFSMLSCYYAKIEYDNSRLIAEKVAQKYSNTGTGKNVKTIREEEGVRFGGK